MCRIAGIITPDLPAEVLKQKVELMCLAQKHGGPDDAGIYSDEQAGLCFGHRRLAIIDLSADGHQPMADIAKQACITFNGEIYNYQVLRNELEQLGARFKSQTDTEVILQAYLHWGVTSFARLKGIFAFGLFDNQKNTTYLVRDSKGVKPLYYNVSGTQLSFASEVRVFKNAQIVTEEDENWPIRFLAFGNIPEPFTTLKGVYSLPKSNYISWHHQTSTFNLSEYTSASDSEFVSTKYEAEQAVSNLLSEAVNKQLIADAPIGVFLSGGIDSSLVTLLANRSKRTHLNTVSISFNEKDFNESEYQSIIQNKIEGQKFGHLVKQADFDNSFNQVMSAMDMPTTDGINTWFISYFARKDGLKAVLSGIGGDELFGGYPSFKRIKYVSYLRKLPTPVLSLIAKANNKFKKITYLKYKHYLADYLFLRGIFSIEEIAALLNKQPIEVADVLFSEVPDIVLGSYNETHASWLETNLYMQNQLLRDTDVMGMSHGLEIRVPFLDEDFCNLADQLPATLRFNNRPKQLLIDSFKDILPNEVWNRPKMGFSFPLQQWMKQSPVAQKTGYQTKLAAETIDHFLSDEIHWSKAFALYQVRQYV